MSSKTLYREFEKSSAENRRLLRQEELILEATELLISAMVSKGLSRSELADRLGRSRGFISQVLSGRRNLTLRTLADISDALGCQARFALEECGKDSSLAGWDSRLPWVAESEFSWHFPPTALREEEIHA